jgi:hypothetical protein
MEHRLTRAEAQIEFLSKHLPPRPETLLKRLHFLGVLRNLLFPVGLQVTVVLAYQAFDREILSAQQTRPLAQQNTAIDRRDRMQDINAEIYRLQSDGHDWTALALFKAKRDKIVRLTDAVHSA